MKPPPAGPLARSLTAIALASLSAAAAWFAASQLDRPADSRAGPSLRGTLYLSLGVPQEESLDLELRQRSVHLVDLVTEAFIDLNPGVAVQLVTFPEETLLAQLPRRQQAGLGPDLILVNSAAARDLERQGQVRAISLAPDALRQIEPEVLARVLLPDGRLVGLPVIQQPELACFNRDRLPAGSPATLEAMLEQSGKGVRFGLSIEPRALFWTVGALGAGDALLAAHRGHGLATADRDRLVAWLSWLQNAALQQHISFYGRAEELLKGLSLGKLDWITCRSSNLSRLQQSLGTALAVAPLPAGPGGPPTPINNLRVLAFGINSSPAQRAMAQELARFSINPLTQRRLTLNSMELLPVNRFVPAPVASSAILASMVRSAQTAEQASPMVVELMGNTAAQPALSRSLAQLVFGDLAPRAAAEMLIDDLRPDPR